MRRLYLFTVLLSASLFLPGTVTGLVIYKTVDYTHVHIGNRKHKHRKWARIYRVPAICPASDMVFSSKSTRPHVELVLCIPKNQTKANTQRQQFIRLIAVYRSTKVQSYLKALNRKKLAKKNLLRRAAVKRFYGDTSIKATIHYNSNGVPARLSFESSSFSLYEQLKRGFRAGARPQVLPIHVAGRIRFE